jgi:hypothetical protein
VQAVRASDPSCDTAIATCMMLAREIEIPTAPWFPLQLAQSTPDDDDAAARDMNFWVMPCKLLADVPLTMHPEQLDNETDRFIVTPFVRIHNVSEIKSTGSLNRIYKMRNVPCVVRLEIASDMPSLKMRQEDACEFNARRLGNKFVCTPSETARGKSEKSLCAFKYWRNYSLAQAIYIDFQ